MTAFHREPATKVARIARDVAQWDRFESEMSDGGEFESAALTAPATNTQRVLDEGELTPNTLKLTRLSDGHEYVAGKDFLQQQHAFLNVAIPEGTQLQATYLRSNVAPNGRSELVMSGNPGSQMILSDDGDCIMVII